MNDVWLVTMTSYIIQQFTWHAAAYTGKSATRPYLPHIGTWCLTAQPAGHVASPKPSVKSATVHEQDVMSSGTFSVLRCTSPRFGAESELLQHREQSRDARHVIAHVHGQQRSYTFLHSCITCIMPILQGSRSRMYVAEGLGCCPVQGVSHKLCHSPRFSAAVMSVLPSTSPADLRASMHILRQTCLDHRAVHCIHSSLGDAGLLAGAVPAG
jgi:hypothetical protein